MQLSNVRLTTVAGDCRERLNEIAESDSRGRDQRDQQKWNPGLRPIAL
jgi:hypothetical protein